MNAFRDLLIEPLNPSHERTDFDCGVESLNRYIKKQAGQDVKRGISRMCVAVKPDSPGKVVGYYTLSSLSIELQDLPGNLSKKLSKHPIPAVLVGRLAVIKAAQGCGVGKMLLVDAIKRILAIREEIGVFAVVVDAYDRDAHRFYERFGFVPLTGKPRRLFLLIRSIA